MYRARTCSSAEGLGVWLVNTACGSLVLSRLLLSRARQVFVLSTVSRLHYVTYCRTQVVRLRNMSSRRPSVRIATADASTPLQLNT